MSGYIMVRRRKKPAIGLVDTNCVLDLYGVANPQVSDKRPRTVRYHRDWAPNPARIISGLNASPASSSQMGGPPP